MDTSSSSSSIPANDCMDSLAEIGVYCTGSDFIECYYAGGESEEYLIFSAGDEEFYVKFDVDIDDHIVELTFDAFEYDENDVPLYQGWYVMTCSELVELIADKFETAGG